MEKLQRAQTHWAQQPKVFLGQNRPKNKNFEKWSNNTKHLPNFKIQIYSVCSKSKKDIQTQKHWYSNPTEVDNTDEITNQTFNKDISLNTELK